MIYWIKRLLRLHSVASLTADLSRVAANLDAHAEDHGRRVAKLIEKEAKVVRKRLAAHDESIAAKAVAAKIGALITP